MTMLGPQSAPGLPEEAIGLPAEAVDADFSDHELCPEWRILATARPNLLVEHVVPGAQETIMGMLPSCAEPILQWGQDAPCSLPTERRGTLVIARVDKLDRAHQQCLFRWLDAPAEAMQVVSMTAEPLFPLVKRRLFLEELYYRLNVVCIDAATFTPEHDERSR